MNNTDNIRHKLTIRLNEKDYSLLQKELVRTGLKMQKYFEKLLNGVIPPDAPSADFFKVLTELRHIGINMNQIAAKANSTGNIDADSYRENYRWLEAVIGQLMEVMY